MLSHLFDFPDILPLLILVFSRFLGLSFAYLKDMVLLVIQVENLLICKLSPRCIGFDSALLFLCHVFYFLFCSEKYFTIIHFSGTHSNQDFVSKTPLKLPLPMSLIILMLPKKLMKFSALFWLRPKCQCTTNFQTIPSGANQDFENFLNCTRDILVTLLMWDPPDQELISQNWKNW